MKKYIAIGHWDNSQNMTSVANSNINLKGFKVDLRGNGFVAWAILTEERFKKMLTLDDDEVWEEVKRITPYCRHWQDVEEYICQCSDIMQERLDMA